VRDIDVDQGVALTLKWTGQEVSTDAEAFFNLSRTTDLGEARDVLRGITTAGQNFVIADRNGDIGWFPYNRLPKRTWATNLDGNAPPWVPIPGTGDYEWDEFFAIEELPQVVNPADGFVATANNDMTGALLDNDPTNEGPPFQVGAAAGYRHAQIVRLLAEEGDQHTPETMLEIVSDTHSFIGEDMTPGILAIANDAMTTLSARAQKVVTALEAWDFECPTGLDGTDSRMSPLDMTPGVLTSASGCAAFHVALRELNTAITRDENAQGDPGVGAPEQTRVNYAAYYSIVDPSQLGAGDVYWDDIETPAVETHFDIIEIALEAAGEFLEGALGTDETEWAWGRIHGTLLVSNFDNFATAAYNNPVPGQSPFANDGGLFTVDVANPNSNYEQTAGPSTRFICEARPEGVACSFQVPGGQSGDIDSPNYEDLLPKWLANEPMPLVLDIAEAEANAERTVELGR
jgi:penicillin amidase